MSVSMPQLMELQYVGKRGENEFVEKLWTDATSCGWLAFHIADSRREVKPGKFVGDVMSKGFPDLVPRECKTKTGTVTREQRIWLDALTDGGFDAGVWRPGDWYDILDTIGERR